ncbi:MAG: SCO family protein [Nocardioides sp.]|nr:SCO family protein [Nocardioides sp.]
MSLLVAAAVLAACGSATQQTAALTGEDHTPYPLASTTLTDTAGKAYTLKTDATKPLTLVFFGYTHCPDECPLVMSTLAATVTRLDAQDRRRVGVVFVTTDPGRDTPAVVKRWLDRYDPSFVGLTGKMKDIVTLASSMREYVGEGTRLPSGGYDLGVHDTHISGVSGGRANVVWDMHTSPKQLADDIHEILEKHPQ